MEGMKTETLINFADACSTFEREQNAQESKKTSTKSNFNTQAKAKSSLSFRRSSLRATQSGRFGGFSR